MSRSTLLNAEEQRIKKRTVGGKTKLVLLRIATFFLSFVILGIGWAGIVAVNYFETEIEEYVAGNAILYYVVRSL